MEEVHELRRSSSNSGILMNLDAKEAKEAPLSRSVGGNIKSKMRDLEGKELRNGLLRLSVLDQSPVPAGSTPGQALQNSIELARLVDGLGYRRFWMSEHLAMDTLACTAPEVMLARIGAETKRIRIGSGGIMLPHYTSLKVAECFRMLHA